MVTGLGSLPRQKSTSGGSSDNDVNEFAVIARISPSTSIAITVTPVTKRPTVCLKVRESMDITRSLGRRIRQLFVVVIFFMMTLTSSDFSMSGTVQPSRLYSAMHCSAKPL